MDYKMVYLWAFPTPDPTICLPTPVAIHLRKPSVRQKLAQSWKMTFPVIWVVRETI